MSNIKSICVSVEGTRPMLINAFGPDAIPLAAREKTGVAGNDPLEWRRTVLMLPENRQLYIRPTYPFGCLRDASKRVKKGARGSIQADLSSTLQIVESIIVLDNRFVPKEDKENGPWLLPTDASLPVYLDVSSVKNPATKGRNVRYRVAANIGWQLSFTIQWDTTVVSSNNMKQVLIDAGVLGGLGDGRSIGYGRFQVTNAVNVETGEPFEVY